MATNRVRLKMFCGYRKDNPDNVSNQVDHISLTPVYSGSEENKAFFAATPGGTFAFFTVNKDAAAMFKAGREYYVDITPADGADGENEDDGKGE